VTGVTTFSPLRLDCPVFDPCVVGAGAGLPFEPFPDAERAAIADGRHEVARRHGVRYGPLVPGTPQDADLWERAAA
jgi:hypothetical protein